MEQKSKSQIKKEMHELQRLGEQLVELSDEQIAGMKIPQEICKAVLFAKTLTKHGAKHRQLQHIGSLMRNVDPEPIRQALRDVVQGKKLKTLAFKQVEQWRDEIVEGNDERTQDILNRFQGVVDRQRLHQLVRNARKEREAGKGRKSSKALFRYLRELRQE
jgi:ribosome-associated protein